MLTVWLPLAAAGQQSLESAYRTKGREMVALFETARGVLQTSSAVVRDGRDEACYGVVVSGDGYILTKASEVLEIGKLSVTVDRKSYREVEVVAVDPTWDVALLKVDAAGLVPVVHAAASDVPQGSWVVGNGATSRTRRRAAPGIISAKIREIPPDGGAALGVKLKIDGGELEVLEATPNSGAAEAGLVEGDTIVSIDGEAVKTLEELGKQLEKRKAGESAKLGFRRDGEDFEVDVRLSTRGEMFDEQKDRNDVMSGDFSKRRSGFPRVMQHDILCNSESVGGPLLDIDGRCLGMNIARANRAENYAIPLEDLQTVLEGLMKQVAK